MAAQPFQRSGPVKCEALLLVAPHGRALLGHLRPRGPLPFGGIGNTAWFWGFLLVLVVLGVLAFVGRRRQATARAKMAEQRASMYGGKR